ncbi:MAG: S8 family serine peptidase [Acutalibacteraceae bacterium]
MKRFLVKAATLILCFALLPTEIIFAVAAETASEPPRYMRELSQLVAATASEDDFGEIKLTLGESEMEVDGEKQEISEDGYAVPFVDEDGVLQIPEEAVAGAEAPDESGLLTEEELEAQGYEVQIDHESGTVTITEPYGLCRLIVKTENGKVQDNFGATHEIRVSNNRTVLQYSDKAATAQAAKQFSKAEDVLFCEQDSLYSICAVEAGRENKCWGTEVAGADQFMATLPDTKDLPQVTVAVIDTGVDLDHPFLEGRILDNGWDFVNDDVDPDDDHSHGTHCAGIVRDATPDNVKILPVKVLDWLGIGVNSVIAEGITYAADCGADIFSMSFSGEGLGEALADALLYAQQKCVIAVAAAGNDGSSLDFLPRYPACCDGVITVAAMEKTDFPAYYSNYGSCIDIAAPGSNIISSVPDGKFETKSGTSMACPLVAGCAALLKSEDMTRTREDILSILSEKARDAYVPGRDDRTGAGIVYLGEVIQAEKMTVSVSHLELDQLSTMTVHPRFEPAHPSDCSVTFTSSDPSVVYVEENGRLHALCGGTATVTICGAGMQTAYTVTVNGGDKIQIADIMFYTGGKFLLPGDGTAWAWGNSKSTSGCYTGSVDGSPFRFQSAPGEYVTDIDRFLGSGFLKKDGTFWLHGSQMLRDRRVPVMAVKENGEPLMGVVQSYRNFVWLEDGTVWYYIKMNDPVFTPLCTADGEMLTDVLCGKENTRFFVTKDGFVYYPKHTRSLTGAASYFNPYPYYADPVLDADGIPLYNVRDIAGNFVLFRDGRLVNYQTNTLLATDVKSFITHNEFCIALKNDGTAWDLNSGEQITKADGSPLTEVVKLSVLSYKQYNALCADGTVWAWGYNGTASSDELSQNLLRYYGTLGVGWCDAKVVRCVWNEESEAEEWIVLGDLKEDYAISDYSYQGYGGSPTNNDKDFCMAAPIEHATQVMIDEDTPLTNVKEMRGALYIRTDSSVYTSGVLRYYGYSGCFEERAVYARPLAIYGQQIFLEQTDYVSPYSFERVQSIKVSKPHMAATVGETFSLTASVFPENTYEQSIRWSSSTPSVADVDGTGKVTVKSVGTAVIRAYSVTNDKVWGQCLLTVEEEAPQTITVRQYPTKRAYTTADTFTTTGGMLTLQYANGQVRSIFISPDFCSGYDLTKTGEQTVQIQFAGSTFTYPITVSEPEPSPDPDPEPIIITALAWLQLPEKQQYVAGTPGERLSVEGGLLLVQYSDGSTEELPLTRLMCDGYDLSIAGEQMVDVTYKGFVVSFPITVTQPEIQEVQLLADSDAETFLMDEAFVPHGTLYVLYTNGKKEYVPVTADMCSVPDMHTVGVQTVEVEYAGQLFTYTIEIYPDAEKIESISMHTLPRVLHYAYNYKPSEMDLTDGKINLHFTDGTTQFIPLTQDMIVIGPSGWQRITGGSAEVTVEYAGKQTTFTVYDSSIAFKGKSTLSITMIEPPLKTNYFVGDSLDFPGGGGTVLLQFSDGTEYYYTIADCTAGTTITTFKAAQTYYVDYYYYKSSSSPYVTITYTVTEKSSGTSTGTPSDDSTDSSDTLMIPPFQLIWYLKPTKTVYCLGEDLDTSGGKFEADVSNHVLSLTPEMCSGYDPMQPGLQTVTVTYTGSCTRGHDSTEETGTLTFDVFVTELVLENEVPEIEVGKCTRVLATFQPVDVDGREILWMSSDPDVATVDAYGRVTGIAPGTVEIMAQVKGSEAVASCTVRVKERQSVYMPGDADGDGEVDLVDVAMIRRYLAGGWNAVIDLQNADVNGDGSVDLRDCVTLERYLAGGWNISL